MQQTAPKESPTLIQDMVAAHLTPEQIVRLMQLKREIASGSCNEQTIEFKRLAFARFRYRLGLLHD